MKRNTPSPRVLFLTVGLGSPTRLEETLYAPLSISLRSGPWDRVVLLPSADTLEYARELGRRHPDPDIHIRPLPPGAEYDADRCYDHFQRTIADLGTPDAEGMCVDITRGTKVMSAALLAAALRYRIPHVRYIEGDRQADNPTIIVPGSERVRDIEVGSSIKHRILDDARELFRHGSFAAAGTLLRKLPGDDDLKNILDLSEFCAAWDRLDYRRADELTLSSHVPAPWSRWVPDASVRGWVHDLARPFPARGGVDYATVMGRRLRMLAVDLFANGERRLHQHQYEDALLRAYRVIEMMGQARLFDHGLDSAALPADHEAVRHLARDLEEGRSALLTPNPDGTVMAGREQVARLLKRLGDPLGARLLDMAKRGALRITSRNHSILIHGYEAATRGHNTELRGLYVGLREVLEEVAGAEVSSAGAPAWFLNRVASIDVP